MKKIIRFYAWSMIVIGAMLGAMFVPVARTVPQLFVAIFPPLIAIGLGVSLLIGSRKW